MFRSFFKIYICFCAGLLGCGFAMAQDTERAASPESPETPEKSVNLVELVRAKNEEGKTALHHLAENGKIDGIKIVISLDADIHALDQRGRTALHLAAENKQAEAVKELIEAGADIHAGDRWGMTALHIAAQKGHIEIAEMLIKADANINVKDHRDKDGQVLDRYSRRHGWTPLNYAVHHDNVEIAEMLLNRNAKINRLGGGVKKSRWGIRFDFMTLRIKKRQRDRETQLLEQRSQQTLPEQKIKTEDDCMAVVSSSQQEAQRSSEAPESGAPEVKVQQLPITTKEGVSSEDWLTWLGGPYS